MESVAEEILREILLKLPTRDVPCGRCVSRLRRRVLTDPSFLHLHAHATHVVSSAGTEALLLSVTHTPGTNPETTVFNVSTSTAMCALDVTTMYGAANACNGFVLLAANSGRSCQLPVFVCNPITGDKLRVEPPLKSETADAPLRAHPHMYAMGYAAPTRQYKLFRLFFAASKIYMHVLTLGRGPEAGVWRRHQGCFRGHGTGSPPVHIDGKLYVLAKKQLSDRKPDRVLIFDVAAETCVACGLPTHNAHEATADVLELHGRPCLAVHEQSPLHRLRFWVLTAVPLRWELRYSFETETGVNNFVVAELRRLTDLLHCRHHHHPRAAWLDGDDGMLCYRYGDRVYKYDTTEGRRRQPPGYNKVWDHHHRLPISGGCQWSIFGGYRPNLLSPHDLATAPQQAEERLEHKVLRVLRSHKSPTKRHRSPCPPTCDRDDERAAKLQKSS